MHLWDRLLPQAVITLNMLRTSRINPKLSAATYIFGQYDFNRAPMAPPGTRIIAHETPSRRRTWAPHGQDGWYIGPALEHNRCYTVISPRLEEIELWKQLNLFLKTLFYHFLQLMKRLTDIFEGATQQKSRVVIPPTDRVDNNAPQRVQTTVSPPRVAKTTAQQMSPQPNTSAHSTPNSHRRQKTPTRRAVAPQAPHVMVRRSARQKHNLSQDMMAGTISQANHCFSISAYTKTQNSKTGSSNKGVIILPEMANAKLLPLPQPPVRARTDARTNPSAQRATQLRSVLARVYAVSIQNQITTTFP
jgi:hypothetical protein